MHRVTCPKCPLTFSRKDVLLRHHRHKHREHDLYHQNCSVQPTTQEQQSSQAYPPPPRQPPPQSSQAYPPPPPPPPALPLSSQAYPPPPPQQQQQSFVFKHPLTANVSGPTACGKTYFVKTLLKRCIKKISPYPERIIWLYKRWQPLYNEIKATVYPRVEFTQGIPLDMEQDTFIHPSKRNLVILDDLMSSSARDPRINELFTEGSHHRNLSMIALNQNMYFNKDPTQRRNCHYLVMFNNPVDQQQIMTLARQMYPGNPQHLMRHFKDATSRPYGYLVIDLKPFTAEHQRLRTDIFDQSDDPKDPTCQFEDHTDQINKDDQKDMDHSEHISATDQTCFEEEKMHSCDDCGLVFENIHDLQRHVKSWCPENRKRKHDEDDERIYKKMKLDDVSSEDDDDSAKEDDDDGFDFIVNEVWDDHSTQYDRKIKQLMEDDMSKKDAKEEANDIMLSKDRSLFMKKYKDFLMHMHELNASRLHRMIKQEIIELVAEKDVHIDQAIEQVIKRHRSDFDSLFENYDESDDEDDSEDDMDTEDNSE
ncbi:hypothetical protein FSP39_016240 [Pinctada imbricata]|uniref:C2H2-type domain-containing protein n=1 Tax=Pinctada imbricata TaxID=66713 RepID=A0AA88XFY9_PINIB|nr:hypothetical protein FSP39_016240 [Pinctada imbricata]